jgi:hypothetical protein
MKKYSRLAFFSLVLGLTGLLVLLAGPGWLPAVAIPLGFAAACLGILALLSIQAARLRLRGRGPAIVALCLGIVVAESSVFVLVSRFFRSSRPINRPQARWEQSRRVPNLWAPPSLPAEPATNFTSNLPLVVLETGGRYLSQGRPALVRAEFYDTAKGRASLGAPPDYAGLASIHRRGNTTQRLPKSSFTFHTVDGQTNQVKAALLGLPAEEDWVLYAPFEDKTLIRDVLAYELANKMGRYAPRTRYVELFITASRHQLSMRDYAGVYVLVEKIKRGHDRVNIAKLAPEDRSEPAISGGYIIKRDHDDRSESRFYTSRGGPYFFVSPKPEAITPEQKAWLARYINAFEMALYGADFRNPQTGYAAYLDVPAFIDAHWLIEVSKNVDGFRYSAFLTKDRGGKLKPGPAWDWNRSFGNADYYGGWQTEGWYSTWLRPTEISWYHRLQDDPDFRQRCTARWLELRQGVLDLKKIHARIDELAAQLEEAQQRNFKRWPILGQQITCNYYVGDTYRDEIAWLKNWIARRMEWIDSQSGRPKR